MYFTGGGSFFGILTCIAVAIMFLSAQSCMIMTDFWLSTWATNEENYMMEVQRIQGCLIDDSAKSSHACETLLNSTQIAAYQLHEPYPERVQYYYTYLALAFSSVFLIFIRSVLYFLMCVRVSRKVYEKLFKSVKDTPVKFFELNPLGRILNRFTKDTNNMDDMISIFIFEFLHVSSFCFCFVCSFWFCISIYLFVWLRTVDNDCVRCPHSAVYHQLFDHYSIHTRQYCVLVYQELLC